MNTITAEQLEQLKQSGDDFTLVNTLSAEHFEKTKIEGAVNIPQDQPDFVEQVEQQAGGKDKKVVVYCANAQCDSSTKAAKKLEDPGFAHVVDSEDGAEGWQQRQVAANA